MSVQPDGKRRSAHDLLRKARGLPPAPAPARTVQKAAPKKPVGTSPGPGLTHTEYVARALTAPVGSDLRKWAERERDRLHERAIAEAAASVPTAEEVTEATRRDLLDRALVKLANGGIPAPVVNVTVPAEKAAPAAPPVVNVTLPDTIRTIPATTISEPIRDPETGLIVSTRTRAVEE